ncbi:MAG: NupC/NupG family nucleoside CNT transporter [Planctomycetaceae bacterium]|jgi:CNT family concentrative nucleoside transporter
MTPALLGYPTMIAFAWLLSTNRARFPWRIVLWGTALQFGFAGLILKSDTGRQFFRVLGDIFNKLISFSSAGSTFLFGEDLQGSFAFSVLPIIIFFSALIAALYHIGLMQFVVRTIAIVMQKTLKTSGPESLSAASNIFVGQTEAPLVIRPYLSTMTHSELMAVMVGGFSTIAGSVMAIYVTFGMDPTHLLTASVISAPAGLMLAKVMVPETEQSQNTFASDCKLPRFSENLIQAIGNGTSDGLMLALNVGAMLIAFLSLIALTNFCLEASSQWLIDKYSIPNAKPLTIEMILGSLFFPVAWLMGVASAECRDAGFLLGLKLVATEFVAYQEMGQMTELSAQSKTILTYALCGFSNFASIGIQIGGIGTIAPERRADLSKLALRAMLGGTLACCMTGCIAAILAPG